jgi:hypothetical protein
MKYRTLSKKPVEQIANEMTAAMLRLHQMDGIEVDLGEESAKEEPPFGWFTYTKGGMRRRNVHEDGRVNRILAGCSQRQR